MQRFDVAIIGSGPEGLVAASVLARAGRSVLVLEKKDAAGGRAATVEFHPGFRAALYADELAAMAPRLFHTLGLARLGAILIPAPASTCVSNAGLTVLHADEGRPSVSVPRGAREGLLELTRETARLREAIAARALVLAPPERRDLLKFLLRRLEPAPWPGGGIAGEALETALRERLGDSAAVLHVAADATAGRACSPLLAGTGLHLLNFGAGRSGMVRGGLGRLGAALAASAKDAGATLRTGASVSEIAVEKGHMKKVVLEGGEEIEARAVLSTLDVKATFLGLVAWSALGDSELKRLAHFRTAGQAARVLLALDAAPEVEFAKHAPDAALGPMHVVADMRALNRAFHAWRSGVLDEAPLVSLRLPSATDPSLAPVGKAVMTATISAAPAKLFDGDWTLTRRERLAAIALKAAERVAPGITARVVGLRIVTGADIESELRLTAGDLDGGEIAPDQVFGFRPFGGSEWADMRTPIRGLYLGGPSSAPAPFLLGAAGERAARAILGDFETGRRT